MRTEDAFYEQFLAPLEHRMMRTAWRIVRDADLARDALQDALALIWQRRDRIRRHPNPEAVVLRICIHAACDVMRQRVRILRREEPADGRDFAAAEQSHPLPGIEAGELQALVCVAIARLPRNQAAALLLRVVQEQSYEEVARTLGCSAITARIHVMRGRQALRRRLSRPAAARREGGE